MKNFGGMGSRCCGGCCGSRMSHGWGMGIDHGMGFGCCTSSLTKKDMLKTLSEHKKFLEEKLEYIKKKEKELSKTK